MEHFKDVHLIDAVDDNKSESVNRMRQVMFGENPTDCAVFIGGMGGVVDEARMIRGMYPDARFLPIFSTNGGIIGNMMCLYPMPAKTRSSLRRFSCF